MDILNKNVKHKTLGMGTIIAMDEANRITVKFLGKISKFQYPEAFEAFLVAEDIELQRAIQVEIQAKKDAVEVAKRIAAEKKKFDTELTKEVDVKRKVSAKDKKHAPVVRTEGKCLTYLVFQGGTFDDECKGQFIWAPKNTKAGGTCHHWDRLLDVREGDVILHCADGYIKAVSRAEGACEDCLRPLMEGAEEQWEMNGRIVKCDYTILKNPIKTAIFKDDILQYCQVKYAPFDKDGNGNMGYLYDIAPGLASIFLKAALSKNKVIEELEYIQWLLA